MTQLLYVPNVYFRFSPSIGAPETAWSSFDYACAAARVGLLLAWAPALVALPVLVAGLMIARD